MLGPLRQVRIADRGEDRVMAEELLDFVESDAGFDQMGCIAVAKRMGRDLFLKPQASTTLCKVTWTPPGFRNPKIWTA